MLFRSGSGSRGAAWGRRRCRRRGRAGGAGAAGCPAGAPAGAAPFAERAAGSRWRVPGNGEERESLCEMIWLMGRGERAGDAAVGFERRFGRAPEASTASTCNSLEFCSYWARFFFVVRHGPKLQGTMHCPVEMAI